MMSEVTKKATIFVKKNKRQLITALAAVLIIISITVVVRRIRRKITVRALKKTSEQHTGTPVTDTLNHGELLVRLAYAMKGPGTNESEIYAVLGELRTQADWDLMQRRWSEAFMSESSLTRTIMRVVYGLRESLIATLKSEMTRKELDRCRKILSSKGITPNF